MIEQFIYKITICEHEYMNLKKLRLEICALLLMAILLSCDNESKSECPPLPSDIELNTTQTLFLELTFEQEFGQTTEKLRKWNTPVNLFVEGNASRRQLALVDSAINDLNRLSTAIPIIKVASKSAANMILFLGSIEEYVTTIEPSVAGIAEGNSGFAVISWNGENEITKASACVDNVNFTGLLFFNRVLREELAQALGIINDTTLDEESVFYQLPNVASNYSENDKKVISYMLGNQLSAGMCRTEVINVVK